MFEYAGDGLTDVCKGGGAENTLTAVVERDALPLEVQEEGDLEAPVEERTRDDKGVSQTTSRSLIFQSILYGDLVLEDRESSGFLVARVRAELRGDEALDTGFGCGLDEIELALTCDSGEG